MIDQDFYADSSSALGLSHHAERAEGVDVDKPLVYTEENPLLIDPAWNEHNNRRLEAELVAAGEPQPPYIVCDAAGRVVNIEDRDAEEQRKREFDRLTEVRPGTPYAELREEAKRIVAARQSPVHRNQGAYDDVREELVIITAEHPTLSLKARQQLAHDRISDRYVGKVDRMDGGEKVLDPNRAGYCGGATIEELMKPGVDVEPHGSRRGRCRDIRRSSQDLQVLYDKILGQAV